MNNPSSSNPKVRPVGFPFLPILFMTGVLAFFGGGFIKERYFRESAFNMAKSARTEEKIQQLSLAVQSYRTNGGVVPSGGQGLNALVEKPVSAPLPRLWVKLASDGDLLDSWAKPIDYYSPARKGGGEFEIVSAGPDRLMNTPDDISSVRDGE